MKSLPLMMLLLVLAISALSSNAQPLQTGFHYRIYNNSNPIYYFVDDLHNPERKYICSNYLRANVKQVGDTLKLDFWSINNDPPKHPDPCLNSLDRINSATILGTRYFFQIVGGRDNMSVATPFISLKYVTWEIGITTIPFKYRFGKTNSRDTIPNDASTSINAGIYLGKKWGRTRFYKDKDRTTNSISYSLAIFLSPTVIAISEETTQKKVEQKSNEIGIGYGIAGMLAYREINFGVLIGIDSPISGESDKWIYANRPWLGFGIGYKLGILSGK